MVSFGLGTLFQNRLVFRCLLKVAFCTKQKKAGCPGTRGGAEGREVAAGDARGRSKCAVHGRDPWRPQDGTGIAQAAT